MLTHPTFVALFCTLNDDSRSLAILSWELRERESLDL